MSAENHCPTCGAEIASDAAEGLCVKCLGRLGFFSEAGARVGEGILRLGDYELLEEIARGGMGVVYRARQLSLRRIVALKVLLHGPFSSADFVRRFQQEALAAASLRHPNIVTIYEVGKDSGNHFLSMEFVEGESFAELVDKQPLPPKRAAGYLKTVAEAVEHAHERGVLHRDLKPSNVLIDAFGEPRVTDFGLAKLADQETGLTLTGQALGSPSYMAPEQAAGRLSDCSAASDVYSLGAILYELLTGRPPFQGESVGAILAQVQGNEPVAPQRLNPSVPTDLQTICLKCLHKEPGRRYATARKLAEDLGRFLDDKPISARPVSLLERMHLWSRRRPLLAALSGGLITAVILGISGVLWQWRQAQLHAEGEAKERLIAEKDAAETRLNLYAADIAVASQALQSGNLGLARRTLDGLRPARGEIDLRGFEWGYLWRQCQGDQLAALAGHTGTVACVTFAPDGRRLASGSHDGTARIWDAQNFTCLATLNVTTTAVWSVAFTPDASKLMTGCNEGIFFWDTATWKRGARFPGELAALSKTGSLLATASSNPFYWEPAGLVSLWDWRTGQLLRRFAEPGRALALSPDGRLLASAGVNNTIHVWETETGRLARELPAGEALWSLSFSPDGQKLLSAGWSGGARVWRLDREEPPAVLSGHSLHVWAAVESDDGAAIATASSDQTARLWSAATLAPLGVLRGHASEVWCAAFSPDASLLATGGKDQMVMVWATTNRNQMRTFLHDYDFVPLFSPDGKRLMTVDPGSDRFLLWDTASGALVSSNAPDGGFVVGFSPDGKEMAAYENAPAALTYRSLSESGARRRVALQKDGADPKSCVFPGMSPDQKLFFAIDADGVADIWDVATGALRRSIRGPAPPIRNAKLSPDGRQFAVCLERENTVRLYDCATGAERRLAGHRDFVSGLAFSPDSAMLATGSVDGTIRLWDAATGVTRTILPGHMQEATDVCFSPDGRTLASLGQGESVKLWHVATGREMVSISLPRARLRLSFSPNGRALAVESDTNTISLFDAPPE